MFLALFTGGCDFFPYDWLCRPILTPNQPLETNGDSSVFSVELPDASLLLNSPTSSSLFGGSDHSSRVAAAMAANASRKRETNVSASALPRSKVPRSTLPHSKNVPDTLGRSLVPPQLTGRSVLIILSHRPPPPPPRHSSSVFEVSYMLIPYEVIDWEKLSFFNYKT